MLTMGVLSLASTVADVEGTQACLRTYGCNGANAFFGSKPSRVQAYGTAIPTALATYAFGVWLKRQQLTPSLRLVATRLPSIKFP
jgi:hypothetical protein